MTSSPARPATRGLGAVLQVPGHPDLPLPALLRYAAADPWAVRLVLLLDPEGEGPDSVEWVFSRSLLVEGLTGSAGEGDVRVRVRGRSVALELAGRAGVLLPLDGLVDFLADAFEVVPAGGEERAAAAALEDGLRDLLAP